MQLMMYATIVNIALEVVKPMQASWHIRRRLIDIVFREELKQDNVAVVQLCLSR